MNTEAKPTVKIQLPTDPSAYGSGCTEDRVEEINSKIESYVRGEFGDRADLSFERTKTPRRNGITCEDEDLADEIYAWIQQYWTAAL